MDKENNTTTETEVSERLPENEVRNIGGKTLEVKIFRNLDTPGEKTPEEIDLERRVAEKAKRLGKEDPYDGYRSGDRSRQKRLQTVRPRSSTYDPEESRY